MSKREIYTHTDLEALPPNVVGELIDGMLYASPRPAQRQAMASGSVFGDLRSPFQHGRGGPGGWVFYVEPELHLGDNALVPDVAGWRAERAPERGVVAFETTPDWLCEVLSPSTAKLDRSVKLAVYARERVPFVWFVDPIAETLEVLQLDGPTYRVAQVFGGDARVRARPFDEVEIDLVGLWTGQPR
ncbi:MAG TPA: Uma2 family endonuclease [Kofleriaceae bacterium]|jgi:Uma2 family endonuclease